MVLFFHVLNLKENKTIFGLACGCLAYGRPPPKLKPGRELPPGNKVWGQPAGMQLIHSLKYLHLVCPTPPWSALVHPRSSLSVLVEYGLIS
jgi:hypothetical protein